MFSARSAHKLRSGKGLQVGMSMLEVVIVMAIAIIVSAMAIPKVISIVQNLRTTGDARDLNSTILMAKMRASADYAKARVYADLSANTFHVDVYPSGATGWTTDGSTQYLSKNVTFGSGSLTTDPNGATLAQAPACLMDDLTTTISNTACIMFNSRGIPVDGTWAPTGNDALYVTDGNDVNGVTVTITGLTKVWRADIGNGNWIQR